MTAHPLATLVLPRLGLVLAEVSPNATESRLDSPQLDLPRTAHCAPAMITAPAIPEMPLQTLHRLSTALH
jgi:hypothetical protein